jgi:hypothetical protein
MELFKIIEDDIHFTNLVQYMSKVKIKDKILKKDFVYNKQYIFKEMFDKELCNEIILESSNIDEWTSDISSVHYQYKIMDINHLSTDTFTSILDSIYKKMPEISELYQLENVKLDITEIVIAKNEDNNNFFSRTSKDVDFLKFTILLNPHSDFKGGDIEFSLYNSEIIDISNIIIDNKSEDKIIKLEQGDMCIHGCLFYKQNNTSSGCMYSLIGYIKPVSVLEAIITY